MLFRLCDLTPAESYRLMTASISPRPIALVTTLFADGQVNAAPFSCFNYMGEDPPLAYLGVERYGQESHRIGELKDTSENIRRTGEFVINMTTEALLEKAVACGTDYPRAVSETRALQIELQPSATVAVPRVEASPVALECTLFEKFEFSEQREIIVGRVQAIHVDDGLIDPANGRFQLDRYLPIARLGGPHYCRTGDRIFMPLRPFESLAER
jgi:2-nitrobenzoate nitroreductase